MPPIRRSFANIKLMPGTTPKTDLAIKVKANKIIDQPPFLKDIEFSKSTDNN